MKKLAIIGANYLQLPLIKKAKEMGLETHVFAWEEGAVGKFYCDFFYPISILEKQLILEQCRVIGIDGICTIASDLAIHAVNYVADKMGLVGNSLLSTELSTDKYKMRERLSKAGLPCPLFSLVKEVIPYDIIQQYSFPLIVKPTDRSGSRGVTKINIIEELEGAVNRARGESLSGDVLVEEFITGDEISVEFISYKGEHTFLATTDKVTTGAPYFVEEEQHEPSHYEVLLKSEIISNVSRALDALDIKNGASHTELLITPDQHIYFVEVGARMGGDNIGAELVHLSTGYDFVKAVIEVALDKKPSARFGERYYAGMFYVLPSSGRIKKIDLNPKLFDAIVEVVSIFELGEIVEYPVRESAHRAGYILYHSKEKPSREDLLSSLIYTIE